MSTAWDPGQYLKFKDERTRPSIDLAARLDLASPASILDVGCGPGNSTEVLRDRWPAARITGLDSSTDMIERARAAHDWGDWVCADAARLGESGDRRTWDIVFSNATLQWIPDHERLIPRLFGLVNRGGALAVQVPANARISPAPVAGADRGRSTVEPVHGRVRLAARVPRAILLLRPAVRPRRNGSRSGRRPTTMRWLTMPRSSSGTRAPACDPASSGFPTTRHAAISRPRCWRDAGRSIPGSPTVVSSTRSPGCFSSRTRAEAPSAISGTSGPAPPSAPPRRPWRRTFPSPGPRAPR